MKSKSKTHNDYYNEVIQEVDNDALLSGMESSLSFKVGWLASRAADLQKKLDEMKNPLLVLDKFLDPGEGKI